MKFLYYLISLPLLILALWAVYGIEASEGVTFILWPENTLNIKLILCAFLLYGFICGRLASWFAYAPMRRDLRLQKKANKALSKEHNKLNETVNGLQQNLDGLKEQVKKQEMPVSPVSQETRSWLSQVKDKFSIPKES